MALNEDMLALSSLPLKYNSNKPENLESATQDLKRYLINAGIINPYKFGSGYNKKTLAAPPGYANHFNNVNNTFFDNNKRHNNIRKQHDYNKPFKPYRYNNLKYVNHYRPEDMISNFQLTEPVQLVNNINHSSHLYPSNHNDFYKPRRKKPIKNNKYLDGEGSKHDSNHFVSPLYMRSPAAASVPIPKNMFTEF